MLVKKLTLGIYGTNCYVVCDEDSKECVIVDPADNAKKIIDTVGDFKPTMIFLTHGHFDHILAVPELQKAYGALTVYCHKLDILKEKTELFMGQVFPTVAAFSDVVHYGEGDCFPIGSLQVKVMETPGHTPGSVVLEIGDTLFTGDTLFRGTCGRVDFEGGNLEDMRRSLARLGRLQHDFKICAGHEEDSTLFYEQKSNSAIIESLRMVPVS